MKFKIQIERPNLIVAEVHYNRRFKKNKLIQWIKSFSSVWRFEFIASKEYVYRGKSNRFSKYLIN